MNKRLSVIISAYDAHDVTVVHVRECMEGLVIPDEIIVVNDGGTPDLKEKLQKLHFNTKVIYARIIQDIPWNYSGARNLGVWLSRGDYISIEDNDHIPMREYYRDVMKLFQEEPEIERVRTHKRYLVDLEDVLNKPVEEWKVIKSKTPHQDTTIMKREVFMKTKGFDERFAGAYGWCSTDWRRRLVNFKIRTAHTGYQYVTFTEPKLRRRLSNRNWKMARIAEGRQPEGGILNFNYEVEILSGD